MEKSGDLAAHYTLNACRIQYVNVTLYKHCVFPAPSAVAMFQHHSDFPVFV